MEKAIVALGKDYLTDSEHLLSDWQPAHEYPLSPPLLALSYVWKVVHSDQNIAATNSVAEAVADCCRLPQQQLAAIVLQVDQLAAQGLRELGAAKAPMSAVFNQISSMTSHLRFSV